MNSRRYWLIVSAISLVVALVTLVVIKAPRTVPLEQCSEVYRRYHDTPGIQASFIRNKKINDTVAVDMTMLVADDSASFARLLKLIGKTDDYINYITQIKNPTARFVGAFSMDNQPATDYDYCNSDVLACFPTRKTIALFHTVTQEQYDLILQGNLQKHIKI